MLPHAELRPVTHTALEADAQMLQDELKALTNDKGARSLRSDSVNSDGTDISTFTLDSKLVDAFTASALSSSSSSSSAVSSAATDSGLAPMAVDSASPTDGPDSGETTAELKVQILGAGSSSNSNSLSAARDSLELPEDVSRLQCYSRLSFVVPAVCARHVG